MTLQFPTPSDGSVKVLQEGLERLSAKQTSSFVTLAGGITPQIIHPHEVFTMGLDDVVAGSGLVGTRRAGWRYLLTSPAGRG
jgi:hypothetical protein